MMGLEFTTFCMARASGESGTASRACGDDVAYTADQLGHEDARFTLRICTQATKRRERLSGPHLRAYDRALEWAQMGTNRVDELVAVPAKATKNPV